MKFVLALAFVSQLAFANGVIDLGPNVGGGGGGGSGNATSIQGIPVSASAPAGGQILQFNSTSGQWQPSTVAGTGTVTSVALTAPAFLSVAGSPITGAGTLALSLATQTANTVFAGPSSGGVVAPTFRSLVAADIPALSYVSSVSGTSPIISSGGTTPAISIPVATSSVNGYLSSTDWSTFNGKQPAGSYANTNLSNLATTSINQNLLPSGPGSFSLGSLALPWQAVGVYQSVLVGSISGAVSNVASSTSATYVLVWPAAQGASSTTLVNNGSGILSWDPVFTLPALTSGSVVFSDGSTLAQDNTNFFWDDTNKILKVGNPSSSSTLNLTLATGHDYTDPVGDFAADHISRVSDHLTTDTFLALYNVSANNQVLIDDTKTGSGGNINYGGFIDRTDAADLGTAGVLVGSYNYFAQSNGAKVSALYAGYLTGGSTVSDGTVTDMYDFYSMPSSLTAGTVTNRYGIYLDADSGYTKQNWLSGNMQLGGSSYSMPSNTVKIVGDMSADITVTDSGAIAGTFNTTSNTTVDGSNTTLGLQGVATATVQSGATNDKSLAGLVFTTTRGDGTDDGTLSGMAGIENLIFHNSGAAGATSEVFGVANILFTTQGDITNYYDLFSQRNAGSGTLANHYGVYIGNDSSTPVKNWMSGRTQMGGSSFSIADSAILDLQSTTGAIVLPRMASADEAALTAANGMEIYNTDTNKFRCYENGAWTDCIGSGGGGSVVDASIQDNSGQSTGTGTWTVLGFNTVLIDSNSAWSTDTYTVPTTGDYFITASILTDQVIFNPTDLFGFSIWKNGALVLYSQRNGQDPANAIAYAMSVSGMLPLTAGDLITIRVYDTATAVNLSTGTPSGNNFTIQKITSAGGGGGANVTLSNLTNPTAINQSLLFGTGVTGVLATADGASGSQNMSVKSGVGAASASGNVSVFSGTSDTQSGDAVFQTGDGSSGNAGTGGVTVQAGNALGTGNSGAAIFRSGSAVNGNVGIVAIQGGTNTGAGDGGTVQIAAGDASGASGTGGSVTIAAGGTAANNGGGVSITTAGLSSGTPGEINIQPGRNNSNIAGNVNLGGHVITADATGLGAPALGACGTSPSIVGNDSAGRITVGTGGLATSCTITFSQAWANTPICLVSDESAIIATQVVPTTTTLTISTALAFAASSKLAYHCVGY